MALYMVLFGNAILVFAIERVVSAFFDKRRTSFPIMILSYFLVWVALGLHFGLTSPIITTLLIYITLLTATLNYKSTMTRRLSALAGSHLMMNAATIVFQVIAFFIPALSSYIAELDFILAMATAYCVAFMMHRHFKTIRSPAQNLHKLLIPFLFLPITQLFVVAFIPINFEIAGIIQASSNGLGIAFLFFYLYYSVSKSFEKDIRSALHTQEKEYYYTQCQLMQESAKQVRSVQHDIKNHLATIKTYTTNGNHEEVKSYLDALMDSIEKSEAYSDTGNIAFDSIINYKLRNAKSDNIQLDLSVAVPAEINIEVVDIVTILGNLLDNALEAVAKTNEKFIKLDIEFAKGGLFTKVENSFNGEINYGTGNAEDRKPITSSKGKEHGYGLKNIQQSIEKYDGYMKISHTENIFSSIVFLYVDNLDMAYA